MKICIFTHCYPTYKNPIGGNFIPEFANELIKRGHRVIILIPRMKTQVPVDFGIPVILFDWLGGENLLGHLNLLNPVNIIKIFTFLEKASQKLKYLVIHENIDLCLVLWAIPNGIPAYFVKKKTGIPYSIWTLGSDINMYFHNPPVRLLLKIILRNANSLFANSVDLRKKVERISGMKCHFMSTVRVLTVQNKTRTDVDKNKPNFIFVGRLEKVKGADILIDSMIELLIKGTDAALYILGDGSLRVALEKKVNSSRLNDKIIFKGVVNSDTVAGYLRDADYLIIPSRSEGMPIVFWEALQMKTRVIGTDVGDLAYWIRKLGVGEVIPPSDKTKLKQAIVKCINQKDITTSVGEVKIPTIEEAVEVFLGKVNRGY
ncbi:MAG: hypothetical protein COX49_02400 [bacterium (Candidatus Stahlbacteria) CG23_combo_of_CG06-09_8_20_14_all_40_9]|nr:MAG: hypothetical protein COX49_02400 [bacterium (Candidatus Stahlbacteria) CG23_combo_of_CG06-09_8_20_14_all_40_9]